MFIAYFVEKTVTSLILQNYRKPLTFIAGSIWTNELFPTYARRLTFIWEVTHTHIYDGMEQILPKRFQSQSLGWNTKVH